MGKPHINDSRFAATRSGALGAVPRNAPLPGRRAEMMCERSLGRVRPFSRMCPDPAHRPVPSHDAQRRRSLLIVLIAVGLTALVVSIVLPSLSRQKYSPNLEKCNRQLR